MTFVSFQNHITPNKKTSKISNTIRNKKSATKGKNHSKINKYEYAGTPENTGNTLISRNGVTLLLSDTEFD